MKDLILQKGILTQENIDKILDTHAMTSPGISAKELPGVITKYTIPLFTPEQGDFVPRKLMGSDPNVVNLTFRLTRKRGSY